MEELSGNRRAKRNLYRLDPKLNEFRSEAGSFGMTTETRITQHYQQQKGRLGERGRARGGRGRLNVYSLDKQHAWLQALRRSPAQDDVSAGGIQRPLAPAEAGRLGVSTQRLSPKDGL